MTEDGEVFKKRKGHVALSPGGERAQYIEHFHVIYFVEIKIEKMKTQLSTNASCSDLLKA